MDILFWIVSAFMIFYFLRQSLPIKGVKTIDTIELEQILDDRSLQLIDVRTPMEYNHYHIKPFKNLPLQEFKKRCEAELDKTKEVVLICRSGSRSLRAARILKKAGFMKITNVQGGINHWHI